jgi:hypothetical protein
MSVRKLIIAVALLSVAATAKAGWVDVIPESATVTLVFIGMATIAFAIRRKRVEQPIES